MATDKPVFMKTTFTTKKKALASRLLLLSAIFVISNAAVAGPGGGGKLEFKSPTLISGTAGADGAKYKFAKVGSNLDAVVTIAKRSDALVYLVNLDMVTSGFDKAWQPQVGYNNGTAPGPADWWMEFNVSFVEEGTMIPATIDEFNLSAIDIDGNGDKIREYVSFYNLKSYTVETNSVLGISNITSLLSGIITKIGTRFDGPTLNFTNIDTSGTAVMVTANYQKIQSFTVRTGGVASAANGAADRMYSLYFQSFAYSKPASATLPVKLTSFDTKLNDSKVQIDWTTAEEMNFSHFVIERSTNGTDYKEIAMIFADEAGGKNAYEYGDNVNKNASGLIYYRLKMIDRDGTAKYSAVRIVKLNVSSATATISAYPNPVTNELRITIPANWQNKNVSYEMISLNGVIVKQQVNAHASQTETLQVNNLQSGNYIVRLRAGDETAVQMIAKR
jgi:hypothetical protein